MNLPEIEIAGTTFFFDINEIALVQKNDHENKIYFNNMWDNGDYYAFHYSPKTKNYHPVRFRPVGYSDGEVEKLGQLLMNNPVEYVEIPRLGKLDPSGMCRKYGCTREDLLIKSDFEIMVNQDIFKSRMEGTPVTIELAGINYEIDLKYNCLRPKDERVEEIFLDNYHYDSYIEDTGVYHLLYNIQEGVPKVHGRMPRMALLFLKYRISAALTRSVPTCIMAMIHDGDCFMIRSKCTMLQIPSPGRTIISKLSTMSCLS